jgi:PAS domain S-box-containing protein
MSTTPGKTIHCPAKGPLYCHLDDEQAWSGQKLSNFFLNFFDLIDVMAILIDDQGIIRLFNRKAEKLTGYVRDEVVGQDWFSLLPEQERLRVREQLMGGLRHEVRHMALSTSVTVKTGGLLKICWSLSLVRDDDGKTYGLFGLGFMPYGPDAPCLAADRRIESYCSSVNTMTHDLLNHSQVVLGYLEMAMDHSGDNRKLQCMLGRATNSLVKCSDLAINVHNISNSKIK